MIWLLAIVILARIAILEVCARYVIVTGESLVAGCAKAGLWLVWMMFFMAFVKRFVSGMVQFSLLGVAEYLPLPLDTPYSATICAVGSWGWLSPSFISGAIRCWNCLASPLRSC